MSEGKNGGINPIGAGVVLGGAGWAATNWGARRFMNPLTKEGPKDAFVKSVSEQIAGPQIEKDLKELKAATETGKLEGLAKEFTDAINANETFKASAKDEAAVKAAATELFNKKSAELTEAATSKATKAITENMDGKAMKALKEGATAAEKSTFEAVETGLKQFKKGAAKKLSWIVGGALAVLGIIIGAVSKKSAKTAPAAQS